MVAETRRIISLWLPRLATDRLTRRAPLAGWRALPLATVHTVRGGLRVAAVNAAAQAAGIGPGMPLANARALRPDLKTVDGRPDRDLETLTALADWCTRYTPWTAVEVLAEDGSGGLWLDATGCAHLFDGEEAMLADALRRLEGMGFAARAGLADTPGAAWAAARFMAGESDRSAIVPEGAARQLLAGLPVAALRLPPTAAETLHRLGLRRIGDLLPLPRAPLAARFGDAVARRLDQLLGRTPEPISPRRPVPPYHARLSFAEAIGRHEDVAAGLRRLLEMLCARLARDRQGARRLELGLFRADGSVARIAVGTGRPVREPAHLARLFAEDLGKVEAGFGIEAMTLAVAAIGPLAAEQAALAAPTARRGDLALLIDQIGNRLGRDGIVRATPRATHLPERAARSASPLEPIKETTWPTGTRPLRMLPRPESVQAVMEAGEVLVRFRWRRQTHRVARAEGPERIAAEWWRAAAPPPPDAVRDYWRVEDDDGRRFWLFREGRGGGWYMHGLFA
ncbi:MAG: DNA polymerase Y family protein [Rhodospirillales bacterium]|nr:DNA polymerase Y family protein [Rhodospirillales bacterium]